jgi:hypothetical protein
LEDKDFHNFWKTKGQKQKFWKQNLIPSLEEKAKLSHWPQLGKAKEKKK